MNGDHGDGGTPLHLRVTEPVLWLEYWDHHADLHETIRTLLDRNRLAEAVTCLETYIGRTAVIRAQVDGWDGPWAYAILALSRNRDRRSVELVAGLLMQTESTKRKEI